MSRVQACILLAAAAALALPLAGCAHAVTGGSPVNEASGNLVINEVVSSNSRSLAGSSSCSPDWIELYNPTGRDIDLSGYRLTDKLKSEKGVLSGGTVKAKGYLLVYADKSGVPAGSSSCSVDYNLPQKGESLYLVDPRNVVLCQVPVPALLTDESYSRRADGTYGFCTSPTPGMPNDDKEILDAEALQTNLKNERLSLNEALPKAADGDGWVELFNAGSADADLSDFCLTDDKSDPTKWHLPRQALKAGEYAVVRLAGKGGGDGMNASFRLGKSDTSVYLYDIAGDLASTLSWQKGIPSGVSVLPGGKYTVFPTEGTANCERTFASLSFIPMDSSDPVRISEALPKNKYGLMDADGERSAWVEIHNAGTQAVSLAGYYLSDNGNNLFKWAFPDTKIEAGGYLVVFLSGKQGKPGELHASFRLSSEETKVYLTDKGSFRTDALALPSGIGSDISVGRDSGGGTQYYARPTPLEANAGGVADLKAIGCFDKTGVFINEVCAANKLKSGRNDWIELHNGGAASAGLAGYYLSDDPENLKKWRIPRLNIAAGGYAVIEASADAPKGGDVAPFGISQSGETLLLSDPSGRLLDAFETGELSPGVTSGRIESDNSIARVYFTVATPGEPNSRQYSAGYAAPDYPVADNRIFRGK